MQWIASLKLPPTLNVVLHRDNIGEIAELIALAERVSADRLELANAQYLGWALKNARGAPADSRAKSKPREPLRPDARNGFGEQWK